MADTIMIRLSEVTDKASVDQLKYWCKLLKIKPKVISRSAHITNDEVALIHEMVQLIQAGKKPSEAAKTFSNKEVTVSPLEQNTGDPILHNRMDSLEKAVLIMAEQIQGLRKENRALLLELRPTKSKTKIIPWSPKQTQRKKYPWYKKIWFELTSPEILRAQP